MQNDLKLKKGETIIPIEKLKAVELGPNDTLIVEPSLRYELSKEATLKIENSISSVTGGKTLLLPYGLIAKAIIKSVKS